jgi:ABC-type transporter Mla subunit MlaD
MGVVSVPGMSIERNVLRRRGLITAAVIIVILLLIFMIRALWPKDEFDVTLRSPSVAAGVVVGAPVRINGLEVGSVAGVTHLDNGKQGVKLALQPGAGKALTTNVEAAYSAGNLFGVSEVILTPRDGGVALKNGAEITPVRPITDNTVSNMIVTIGDVNDDAVRPYMGQVLANFDASSKAMEPLITAIGAVADAVQQTQTLPTSKTFPIIADTLQQAEGAANVVLPAVQGLHDYAPLHDPAWVSRAEASIDSITNPKTGLTGALQAILDPKAIDGLKTATPTLVILLKQVLQAFPNAPLVGIQLGQLMDNTRRAMPNTPNGPVLNVVLNAQVGPALALLPPLPPPFQFQYIPHQAGAQPAAAPSSSPNAGASAQPTAAPTSKAGN